MNKESVNIEKLKLIAFDIDKKKDEISTLFDMKIKPLLINTLNNSWVGADCAAYTEKLTNMDKRVHNTIDSLDLLCSTYEKAKQMVQDRQTDVINTINNS